MSLAFLGFAMVGLFMLLVMTPVAMTLQKSL